MTIRELTTRVTGVLLAAAVAPLIVMGPAHANADHCKAFIKSQGYQVGPKVVQACTYAANPNNGPARGAVCRNLLVKARVEVHQAITACREAFR